MSKIRKTKYQFKRNNLSFNHGITLISLVITIILLIILAGVGINLALGENGLFKKAKYAKEKYLNAQVEEERALNELYEELGLLGELPENTPETEAGKVVKMPNSWETTLPAYVSDKDGKEVVASKKVASVYAVSAGNGNTIPVPLGFYYVGGTIDSGIVISDNKEDQNKYAGKEDVSKELKGNQFVWIPCKANDYHKIDFGKENAKWDMEGQAAEYPQIIKYNGFYIGRYEAGVATLNQEKKANGEAKPFDDSVTFDGGKSLFNSVAIQTGINNWGWQNYDFTARRTGTPVTTGTNKATGNVVVKADSIPYYHVDYYTAVEMSERLYRDNNYVKSGLVTGTQWDIMMKYMRDTGSVDILTSTWGNYDNVSLSNLTGYYTNVNTSSGATDGFKNAETLTTNAGTSSYVLLTTGSTEQVKKMNLYDVAGNLWEWTQEAAYYKDITYTNATYNTYVLRGGAFGNASSTHPAAYRACGCAPLTYTSNGFRLALYLQ